MNIGSLFQLVHYRHKLSSFLWSRSYSAALVTKATSDYNNGNGQGLPEYNQLKRSDLIIQALPPKKRKPLVPLEKLVFGHHFTDHMLRVEWKNEESVNKVDSIEIKSDSTTGWSAPLIKKYDGILLPPSATVFHYGSCCFEGMKAYRDSQGRIRLFRPDLHIDRFHQSAGRITLPLFDRIELLECIKELIRLESRWIPKDRGYSLYIRPTLIGTQDALGVSPSDKALLFTICCPVGPYYKTGFSAVSLIAEESFIRAWPGGTGCYKIGGNYAPGILPQLKAQGAGYQQILWLFGPDAALTEVGTMNVFVALLNERGEKELVTPPLDGTILPGITRDCILTLAKNWDDFVVSERKITMHEIEQASGEKRVLEMFGTGTAAIVCPIKHIHWRNKDFQIPLDPKDPLNQAGPIARRLANTIMDIQYGVSDFDQWSVIL